MQNIASIAKIECILKVDWSNYLYECIENIRAHNGIGFMEAKIKLRRTLNFTKGTLDNHLECSSEIAIEDFYYACCVLGVVYILDKSGNGRFVEIGSIGDGEWIL